MGIPIRIVFGAAIVAAVAVPAIAMGHGKVGLWSITVTTDMAGMPDMSKLPPEAQAAMRAHGVRMGGHSMTVSHCMTEDEVSASHPQMHNEEECKLANVKTGANMFSADMTCATGEMNTTGHMEFAWDSAEHYTGKQTMTGTSGGHPINQRTSFEGRWVSADCKGATH